MEKDLAEIHSRDYENKISPASHVAANRRSPHSGTTPREKTKRHCKRFWWIWIIAFALVIMIVVLVVIYAGMPHIAQKGVNETKLNFDEQKLLHPTSNSITLTQRATLNNPSRFTPTLDGFDADLYLVTNDTYGSKPLMTIPIPKVQATKPTSEVLIENVNITFQSLEQVTAYTKAVLGSEYVTTALKGRTKLHLGGLPVVHVNYNEKTSIKGFNGLKGFNVTDLKINPTATSGPNMVGLAYIPNASILTVEMGNVTFMLTAKSGVIGNVSINDMILRPGNNTLPMTGTLNQTLVLGNQVNGILEFAILGQSAVYNGQHLTYYEEALAMNTLSLSINVTEVLRNSLSA